jgi:uncharacterized protein YbjT (DUF2867 family)
MRGDTARKVAVFGGTGFLGRRIVRHFLDHGAAVRVVARHPQRGEAMFRDHPSPLEFVVADVNDNASIRAAVSDTFAVVNAVSLYVEHGDRTFRSVHVDAAACVAARARDAGVTHLVHVSGIGADPRSRSPYIRSRGEGEDAVRASFPGAIIIRPAVMFGLDDAFLTSLIALLRGLPVFPLFGHGRTALQPAYVDDVAQAVVRAVDAPSHAVYELGGPRTYTYKDLLQILAGHLGIRRIFVPVPFAIWQALAFGAEMLPRPPITRNQVELMVIDTVTSPACPGFRDLAIEPRGIEAVLEQQAAA